MILTPEELGRQRARHQGSGGSSQENQAIGFRPAFLDTCSGRVFQSLTVDGQAAPLHLLDGLPDHWILERDRAGSVLKVKDGVVAGFLRDGQFYTREEAARLTTLESSRVVANSDAMA